MGWKRDLGGGGLAYSPIHLEIFDGLVTLYVMLTLTPTSHNTASERSLLSAAFTVIMSLRPQPLIL